MDKADVRSLYLFGAGGHSRELAWLGRECFPAAQLTHVVDDERFRSEPLNGITVRLITELELESGAWFVAAVGDSALRRRAAEALHAQGFSAVSLVHPRVEHSPTVQIAPGAVVGAGSVLTDNVSLGRHAHVNIGCTLSHDVTVGDFATISPGVHIAGNVRIEEGAFLGIGASVINGTSHSPLTIGAGATIAAGACVTRDVPAGAVVAGVPARELRQGRDS